MTSYAVGQSSADDGWIMLTAHELGYMLSLGEGSFNQQSRGRLGIPESDALELVFAGAATLLVRGLGKSVSEAVEPVEQAALVSWALSTAHTWVEVGARIDDKTDALLVCSNDDVGVVFAPQALGIFGVLVIDPGERPAEVALAFAGEVLDRNEDAAISVRKINEGNEASAGVSKNDGVWELVSPLPDGLSSGDEGVPVPARSTRAASVEALAAALR